MKIIVLSAKSIGFPRAGFLSKAAISLGLVCSLALAWSGSACAQSTWLGNGTDDNWQTAGNWNSVPSTGSSLTFTGTTTYLTNNNNFAVGTSFASITFSSGAASYTLTGNNVLLSNTGGTSAALANNSSNLQTIEFGVEMTGSSPNINVGAGGISLTGSLTFSGTQNLTINGASGSTGTLTLSGGATMTGGGNPSLTLDQGGLTLDGGTYSWGVGAATHTYAYIGNVNGETAALNIEASTTATFSGLDVADASGSTGNVNQSGGSVTLAYPSGTPNTLNVAVSGVGSYLITGGTLSAGGINVAGGAGGTGTLTVNGSGVTVTATAESDLAATSTSNGTLIIDSGTIDFTANPGLLMSNAAGASGTVDLNGGVLGISRITLTSGDGSGTINFNGGTLQVLSGSIRQIDSTITLVDQAGGAVIDLNSSGGFGIGGALTHASALGSSLDGGLTVEDTGGTTSTLTLSGANTFTGTTTVAAGVLDLKNALALQDSTLSTAGVVFDSTVTANGNAFTLGGLAGSGNIALQNNAGTPAAVALSVGNNNQNTTYSGSLSGGGSLTKIGTGALTLNNASNYSGGTTVTTGTLLLGNGSNGSATGSGALSVSAGATIGGSGTGLTGISNTSSFAINGNVQVGNGTDNTSSLELAATGALTSGHNGTFSGANLTFNLASNSTNANVLNLGATAVNFATTTLTLNIQGANIITPGTAYVLITDSAGFNPSTDGLTIVNGVITGGLSIGNSTFFGAPSNGYSTGFYNGSYLFVNGDNIEVEVVPEPSTWALMLGGLVSLIGLQRIRRRN